MMQILDKQIWTIRHKNPRLPVTMNGLQKLNITDINRSNDFAIIGRRNCITWTIKLPTNKVARSLPPSPIPNRNKNIHNKNIYLCVYIHRYIYAYTHIEKRGVHESLRSLCNLRLGPLGCLILPILPLLSRHPIYIFFCRCISPPIHMYKLYVQAQGFFSAFPNY